MNVLVIHTYAVIQPEEQILIIIPIRNNETFPNSKRFLSAHVIHISFWVWILGEGCFSSTYLVYDIKAEIKLVIYFYVN